MGEHLPQDDDQPGQVHTPLEDHQARKRTSPEAVRNPSEKQLIDAQRTELQACYFQLLAEFPVQDEKLFQRPRDILGKVYLPLWTKMVESAAQDAKGQPIGIVQDLRKALDQLHAYQERTRRYQEAVKNDPTFDNPSGETMDKLRHRRDECLAGLQAACVELVKYAAKL